MADRRIIDLYWQRDENAVRETDAVYGAYCCAIARNILGSREDAEECVSDTWLQAWNAIPPQRPANLRLFLAKITRNLAFNKYKARTADKRGGGEIAAVLDELEDCLADGTDTESAYFAKELEQGVGRFVRTLAERERCVFVRRYFFTEPVAEIAARYGLTENNVMVILSRTRQKLKNYLKQGGYLV